MTTSMQLVVSVDTEEEGLWGGQYAPTGNTTENLRGLPRFQSECERLSVPPTYLIDAPVLDDVEAIRHLSGWQQSSMCEVGSHCHPWCNPPIMSQRPTTAETFLCNLPPEVQHQKLKWLTDRIANAMGRAPTSYRAGRYGFDQSTAEILDDLGYRVDSSVLPMYDYRSDGGPNFRELPREPYRYFGTDLRSLVEIPITSGFTRRGFEHHKRRWEKLRSKPWTWIRAAGIADRLNISRRLKLSPEATSLADLRSLVSAGVKDGLTTLVLMLHSSSLVAGCSPYAVGEQELDQLYHRLTCVINYAIEQFGFRPVTLTQAAENLFPLNYAAGIDSLLQTRSKS